MDGANPTTGLTQSGSAELRRARKSRRPGRADAMSSATAADPVEADAEDLLATARAHLGEHWSETFGPDMLDEHAQSAYEQLLALERSGEHIDNPKALIKKIAWRVAGKDAARRRPDLVDPNVLAAKSIADRREDPSREVELRSEIVNVAVVVDQLDDSQQAIFRARFVEKLTVRQTARRLGLSKSSVQRTLDELRQHFEPVLSAAGDDDVKVKVLTAYSFGDTSVRKAAEALLKHDPTAATIYRQLRGFHEGAAALVPPATLEVAGDHGLAEKIGGGLAAVRDRLTGGGADAPSLSETATQVASSGAGRGSGAAAGGTFSALAAALGGKGVAACVGGAATAACVGALTGAGVGPLAAKPDPERPKNPPAHERPAEPPREELPPIEPAPDPAASPEPAQPAGATAGADAAPAPSSPPPPPTSTTTTATATDGGCNPYDPACAPAPTPASAPAPEPTASTGTGGGGSGGGGGGGCNPYDPAC